MRTLVNIFRRHLLKEDGVTLIEILAACTIFFILLLPLSSMYTKGISLYANTQAQTSLRNETDFLLGTIMNEVGNASSFELENDTSETTSTRIFTHPSITSMVRTEDNGNLRNSIVVYNRSLSYDDNSQRTESIIQRAIYRFHPPSADQDTNLYRTFPHTASYLVSGMFATSSDHKKLIVYLVIAPRGTQTTQQDGRTTAFANWDDVLAELTRQPEGKLPDTIHMIRTEFAVNNLVKG